MGNAPVRAIHATGNQNLEGPGTCIPSASRQKRQHQQCCAQNHPKHESTESRANGMQYSSHAETKLLPCNPFFVERDTLISAIATMIRNSARAIMKPAHQIIQRLFQKLPTDHRHRQGEGGVEKNLHGHVLTRELRESPFKNPRREHVVRVKAVADGPNVSDQRMTEKLAEGSLESMDRFHDKSAEKEGDSQSTKRIDKRGAAWRTGRVPKRLNHASSTPTLSPNCSVGAK